MCIFIINVLLELQLSEMEEQKIILLAVMFLSIGIAKHGSDMMVQSSAIQKESHVYNSAKLLNEVRRRTRLQDRHYNQKINLKRKYFKNISYLAFDL